MIPRKHTSADMHKSATFLSMRVEKKQDGKKTLFIRFHSGVSFFLERKRKNACVWLSAKTAMRVKEETNEKQLRDRQQAAKWKKNDTVMLRQREKERATGKVRHFCCRVEEKNI